MKETDTKQQSPASLPQATCSADPDLGPISRGHACKHGVRWPHYCHPCAERAYERFLEDQAKLCICDDRPCPGVLAGGLCDSQR